MKIRAAVLEEFGQPLHVTGVEWLFVILAFLLDLGAYDFGRRSRR